MSRRRQSPDQVGLDMVTDPADLAALAVFEAEVAKRRAAALAAAQGRPVAFDCETAGKVWCWTCAISGPERCLEDHLPAEVHEACEAEARRLAVLRDGAPCHDCAFLAASHEASEEGLLAKLTRQREAFHCHQAMPLDGRGKVPADGDFAPRDHARYPVCTGWARARPRARVLTKPWAMVECELIERNTLRVPATVTHKGSEKPNLFLAKTGTSWTQLPVKRLQ